MQYRARCDQAVYEVVHVIVFVDDKYTIKSRSLFSMLSLVRYCPSVEPVIEARGLCIQPFRVTLYPFLDLMSISTLIFFVIE